MVARKKHHFVSYSRRILPPVDPFPNDPYSDPDPPEPEPTTPTQATSRRTPLTRLGPPRERAIYAPFNLRQLFELFLVLPLNLIPVIGVPLFILITGYRAGPLLMWRYFTLRAFSKEEREAFVKKRRLAFTG